VTDLSFEHVPPRAAFNDYPVWVLRGEEVFRADLEILPRGVQQQRGAGENTLCVPCNTTTGAWYGGAFAAFAFQAAQILYATRGRASLHCPFHFAPLRVLKQIVCMFMSINSPALAQVNPELVRFVKNPAPSAYPRNTDSSSTTTSRHASPTARGWKCRRRTLFRVTGILRPSGSLPLEVAFLVTGRLRAAIRAADPQAPRDFAPNSAQHPCGS
jgi:hypothetical protein